MQSKAFGVYNGNADRIAGMLAEAGIPASITGRNATATNMSVSADKYADAMKVIALLDSQAEQAGKTFPLWELAMAAGFGVITLASLGFLPFALLPVTLVVFGAWIVVFVFDTVLYNRAWARTAKAHGAKRVAVGAWIVGLVVLLLVALFVYAVALVWIQEGIL